jgi:hypothetical protein
MGDILAGIFGGGSRTTEDTKPDPVSQELNALRRDQLAQLFRIGAQYSDFAPPGSGGDAYTPSPDVKTLFDDARSTEAFPDLMSFDEYLGLGLDQTKNYISQIATPEIKSNAALAGLDSGGIVPEAIAKATAQIGLPFVQSLPGASTALTMAPFQAKALKAQTAATLFPMADYGRGLKESDLLRRQGVVTTGLTGIPYTPGQSTAQRQSSQPLFNLFGQG